MIAVLVPKSLRTGSAKTVPDMAASSQQHNPNFAMSMIFFMGLLF